MSEEDQENYEYRCIGRKGERTIARLRKQDGATSNRTGTPEPQPGTSGVARTAQPDSAESETDTEDEEMEEDQPTNNKRGRGETDESVVQDESPRQPKAKRKPRKTT